MPETIKADVCQRCQNAMHTHNWTHLDPDYCYSETVALRNVGELIKETARAPRQMPGHWTCWVCEDVQICGLAVGYHTTLFYEELGC